MDVIDQENTLIFKKLTQEINPKSGMWSIHVQLYVSLSDEKGHIIQLQNTVYWVLSVTTLWS